MKVEIKNKKLPIKFECHLINGEIVKGKLLKVSLEIDCWHHWEESKYKYVLIINDEAILIHENAYENNVLEHIIDDINEYFDGQIEKIVFY